jgi:hypothetical protein
MRTIVLAIFFLLAANWASAQVRANGSMVKFFPNPAVSQITFEFPSSLRENYSFQIYNFLGKKVFEQPTLTAQSVIDLNSFYRGLYIFQLRDRNGRIIQSGRFHVIH